LNIIFDAHQTGLFTDRVMRGQAGYAKRNRNKWMVRQEVGLCRSLLAESVNKPELCGENDEVLKPHLTKQEHLRLICAFLLLFDY
jgi:hypothetical protein